MRDRLVENGKLTDTGAPDQFEFAEDVAFSSPSAAAAVVAAGNRHGHTYWRVEQTTQTYTDSQKSKLEDVAAEGPDGGAVSSA